MKFQGHSAANPPACRPFLEESDDLIEFEWLPRSKVVRHQRLSVCLRLPHFAGLATQRAAKTDWVLAIVSTQSMAQDRQEPEPVSSSNKDEMTP